MLCNENSVVSWEEPTAQFITCLKITEFEGVQECVCLAVRVTRKSEEEEKIEAILSKANRSLRIKQLSRSAKFRIYKIIT